MLWELIHSFLVCSRDQRFLFLLQGTDDNGEPIRVTTCQREDRLPLREGRLPPYIVICGKWEQHNWDLYHIEWQWDNCGRGQVTAKHNYEKTSGPKMVFRSTSQGYHSQLVLMKNAMIQQEWWVTAVPHDEE